MLYPPLVRQLLIEFCHKTDRFPALIFKKLCRKISGQWGRPANSPSPITSLSTLESHLWEAANILRGSPVDRTDWKSYILPLLFFKRICDVWDEEYQEAVETYGEDFADERRFQIPKRLFLNSPQRTQRAQRFDV